MNPDKQAPSKKESEAHAQDQYEVPVLTELGSILDLTQGSQGLASSDQGGLASVG